MEVVALVGKEKAWNVGEAKVFSSMYRNPWNASIFVQDGVESESEDVQEFTPSQQLLAVASEYLFC